jgi:hypothetical protein
LAGPLVASPPAVTTPMANLIAYYEANRQMVMMQAYLTNGLTGILLMVFVASFNRWSCRFIDSIVLQEIELGGKVSSVHFWIFGS